MEDFQGALAKEPFTRAMECGALQKKALGPNCDRCGLPWARFPIDAHYWVALDGHEVSMWDVPENERWFVGSDGYVVKDAGMGMPADADCLFAHGIVCPLGDGPDHSYPILLELYQEYRRSTRGFGP